MRTVGTRSRLLWGCCTVILLVIAACGPAATLPAVKDLRATIESKLAAPTATPIFSEESIDLSSLADFPSVGRSSAHAEIGSRVEVTIGIIQEGNMYARCGEPSVKDSFGNVMAVLSPVEEKPGEMALYKYAFYAPVEGTYTVELDNFECAVGLTSAEATVKWIVHQR